jgi:hypothetical protein
MEDARSAALRTWLGYGNWKAKYWFVGMEPGGVDDAETYNSWLRLGGKDLIDLREHNLEWNKLVDKSVQTHWFDPKPRIQRTWASLIRLLLSFQGRETDTESVRKCQSEEWGTLTGETALIELSAAAAPSTGHDVDGRGAFATSRSDVLARKLFEESPTFVVFYGTTYRDAYSAIAGAPFDESGFAWAGNTLCVLVQHPRVRPSARWWISKGKDIRHALDQSLIDAHRPGALSLE